MSLQRQIDDFSTGGVSLTDLIGYQYTIWSCPACRVSSVWEKYAKTRHRRTYMIICHRFWTPSSISDEDVYPHLLALHRVWGRGQSGIEKYKGFLWLEKLLKRENQSTVILSSWSAKAKSWLNFKLKGKRKKLITIRFPTGGGFPGDLGSSYTGLWAPDEDVGVPTHCMMVGLNGL